MTKRDFYLAKTLPNLRLSVNHFLIVGRNIITMDVGEIFTLNHFKNLLTSYYA